MTKRQREITERYFKSNASGLWQVYGRFSHRKATAEESIRQEMYDINGYDFRIVSHNSNFFSCAYQYTDQKTDKGMLVYHTASKREEWEIYKANGERI